MFCQSVGSTSHLGLLLWSLLYKHDKHVYWSSVNVKTFNRPIKFQLKSKVSGYRGKNKFLKLPEQFTMLNYLPYTCHTFSDVLYSKSNSDSVFHLFMYLLQLFYLWVIKLFAILYTDMFKIYLLQLYVLLMFNSYKYITQYM